MFKIAKHISKLSSLSLILLTVLISCSNNGTEETKNSSTNDTPKKGTIYISVDETFKPVIDSQIKVYQGSFPETEIIAEYKSEAECLRDLENDSTRMVIVTRGLTREETKGFKEQLRFAPSWGLIAYDAMAVVLNKKSKLDYLSTAEIRSMLNGTAGGDYEVVMDGLSATSTVRYAIDSLLKGEKLGPKVVAAKSSEEVIAYVQKNENAVGLVGVSWVGDKEDDQQVKFLQSVKVARIKCETCPGEEYVLPYQGNIALGKYPFIRGIYYILKENYEGLGRGFVNFLIYERGQLIFKRAYLLPARMEFRVRNMEVKEH
jgi:phosphate transport system substrate-binding protein